MRYVFLVCYDGTGLSGFQRQAKGERTVQGELERALSAVAGAPVRVYGSGRTDAGVHALGQVCHADFQTEIPAQKLSVCMNAFLPPDIRVLKSGEAPEGFDCTRGARQKTYHYRFYTAEEEIPLLGRYAVRVKGSPDPALMRAFCGRVEGEHDFAAFRAAGSSAKTTVRTVYAATLLEERAPLYTLYTFSVTGNGFLYNMVRILAGELVAAGMGKRDVLPEAFRTGERSLLAGTMPARGLTLYQVEYGVPLFGTRQE